MVDKLHASIRGRRGGVIPACRGEARHPHRPGRHDRLQGLLLSWRRPTSDSVHLSLADTYGAPISERVTFDSRPCRSPLCDPIWLQCAFDMLTVEKRKYGCRKEKPRYPVGIPGLFLVAGPAATETERSSFGRSRERDRAYTTLPG